MLVFARAWPKKLLTADGIIATKIGGGAVDTDLMMIYTRCRRNGHESDADHHGALSRHRHHIRAVQRRTRSSHPA